MGRDTRRTRLVLVLLLLTALTLVMLDDRTSGGGPIGHVRSAVADVLGPVQAGVSAAVRPVTGLVDDLRELGAKDEQISRLEAENRQLRQDAATRENDLRRLAEYDALARQPTVRRFPDVAARVTALSRAQGFTTTASLDVGSQDGVRDDTTVINGDGLVGRVKGTARSTSTVLLATDPDFVARVRVGSTGATGFVEGQGEGKPLALTIYDTEPLEPGTALVTVGSVGDGPLVADVLVGRVADVRRAPGTLTTRATVTPAVDFAHLDTVAVVLPGEREARGSVPAATPGASPAAGRRQAGAGPARTPGTRAAG
ncbi:rod shape-determining protein MreC [Motilibacter aurantiacus]|uniref:rod shape-determining protein MreC n=1 Tax=Motilibacter aurantiacus TaxID=2714955 RepID=UPI00140AE7BA|nr:rod shape-determining protein MreC [Motilibacter aurantiacus]NHC45106.1 rod shape-determining protein MreC [Motilibacter aurantiacus]